MYDHNVRRALRKLDESREPVPAGTNLPIASTIDDTYRFVFSQLKVFLAYAFVPVLVSSLLTSIAVFSDIAQTAIHVFEFWSVIRVEIVPQFPLLFTLSSPMAATTTSVVFGATYIAIYVLFAVAWHRRYIIGTAQTSSAEMFSWRRRHLRFLWNGVLLIVVGPIAFVLGALLLSQILQLVLPAGGLRGAGLLLGIPIFAIILALAIWWISFLVSVSLVFPAAAVEDSSTGFRTSRKLTRGYKWDMFVIIVFGVWLPLGLLSWGFGRLTMSQSAIELWSSSAGLSFLFILISNLISFISIALGVSALSIIYKTLIDHSTAETEPEGSSPA